MKLARTLLVLLAASATASALAVLPAAAQEATPSASPRPPCGAPPFQSIQVDPASAGRGDTVTVTVLVRDEPCYPDEPEPHEVQLFAQPDGSRDPHPLARGTTDSSGRFVYVHLASTSTTYYLTTWDGERRGGNSSARLTVDSTSGTCANALQLSAPSAVEVGSQVLVSLSRSDTATATISFRKRGQTSFTVRRVVPSGQQYSDFQTYFKADDDYRIYASTERCDSQPILVTAAPVITGPASVRKGSQVTLTVRATPGMPLAVAFRRSGQTTFAVRRTGTANTSGVYTTTYKADADYQYYAQERPGQQSAAKVTQAR